MAKSTSAETDKEILFSLSVPFTNEIAASSRNTPSISATTAEYGSFFRTPIGHTQKIVGRAPVVARFSRAALALDFASATVHVRVQYIHQQPSYIRFLRPYRHVFFEQPWPAYEASMLSSRVPSGHHSL
jgi:transposase